MKRNLNLKESLEKCLTDKQIELINNFLDKLDIEPKINFYVRTFDRVNYYNIDIVLIFNDITIICDEFKIESIQLFNNDFDWYIAGSIWYRDIIDDYIFDLNECKNISSDIQYELYDLISGFIIKAIKIHIDNYFKSNEYKSKLQELKLEIIKSVSKQLSDANISLKEFQATALLS